VRREQDTIKRRESRRERDRSIGADRLTKLTTTGHLTHQSSSRSMSAQPSVSARAAVARRSNHDPTQAARESVYGREGTQHHYSERSCLFKKLARERDGEQDKTTHQPQKTITTRERAFNSEGNYSQCKILGKSSKNGLISLITAQLVSS